MFMTQRDDGARTLAMPNPAARAVLAVLVAFLLAAPTALAQGSLPANAAEAIDRGEQLMEQALNTYDAQYPDRPLWRQAFREGTAAVQLAPGHPEPLRFLAEAYSRANWPGPAVRTWEQFLAAGGTLDAEAEELYVTAANANAYSAYAQGNLERAAELYLNVTRNVPTNVEAHRWLGRILLEAGRPDQAVAAWQTVTELTPDDQGAEYFLDLSRAQARWGTEAATAFFEGVAAYEAGNMTQARNAFALATARNADYAQAWAWLGRVAFEQGSYQDALNAYTRAANLDPSNTTYSWFRQESQRLAGGGSPSGSAPPPADDGADDGADDTTSGSPTDGIGVTPVDPDAPDGTDGTEDTNGTDDANGTDDSDAGSPADGIGTGITPLDPDDLDD